MKIIPAIYLSSGKAVSNYKGQSEQSTVLSGDPLSEARRFEKNGARTIHLVDIDEGPKEVNHAVAKSIAKNTSLEVEYADGIGSISDIKALFGAGITRVSLSQFSEKLVPEALKTFGPEKIIFTIRTQRQVVEGRPGLEVFHYGASLAELGLRHIILRDTKSEGTFHPNFDEVERLILGCRELPEQNRPKIFSFGGVGKMDDLDILAGTGAAGAIISLAFFENRLSLRECVEKFEA